MLANRLIEADKFLAYRTPIISRLARPTYPYAIFGPEDSPRGGMSNEDT
jgi:hypothetical protein